MTPGPNELKAALQRLIDGNASEADRDAVRTALNTGVLVTGERAVAIGGNASDVIITTGDQNLVFSFKGADAATVLTALGSIAPTRLHEMPRPSADSTGHDAELKGLLVSIDVGLGDTRHAVQFHEQHLAIAREIGDRRGEGAALSNPGIAYADLGEAHHAIEFDEQALLIHREIGDRRNEGNTLGSLGIAYRNLDETRPAIQFFEQQLAIAREIGDRCGEGNALCNLGVPYAHLGETDNAIQFYEQYLAIACGVGDRRGEGNALWNMSLA